MPRLTILMSEEHARWLATRAKALGFPTPQDYLRSILIRRLGEYDVGLGPLPPGEARAAEINLTLTGPLARQIEVAAERLAYTTSSDVIRACIQEECDPFAQTARGQGFVHGQALRAAVAMGNVAPLVLSTDDYTLGTRLANLANQLAETEDEHVADLLDRLTAAIKAANQRRQSPPQPNVLISEEQLQQWTATAPPDNAVPYATTGLSYSPLAPTLDIATYLGKMGGLFTAILRSAQTRREFVVTYPESLGDTWEETLQTLSFIAELRLALTIRSPHSGFSDRPAEYQSWSPDLAAAIQQAATAQVPLLVGSPYVLGNTRQTLLQTLSSLANSGVGVIFTSPVTGLHSLHEVLAHSAGLEPQRPPLPVAWPYLSVERDTCEEHSWEFRYPRLDGAVMERFDTLVSQYERAEMFKQGECDLQLLISELRALLRECPEFTDAYHHLALFLSQSPEEGDAEEAAGLWQEAVAQCLAALPPDFQIGRDHLSWYRLDNRPFLRSYHALGLHYQEEGDLDKAVTVYENILALNPSDNQGIRDLLVGCYLEASRPHDVIMLQLRFTQGWSPALLYGRVLALLQLGRVAEAQEALREALERRPLVAQELTREEHVPTDVLAWPPHLVACGGADEAFMYWEEQGELWEYTPGALEFVQAYLATAEGQAAVQPPPPHPKVGKLVWPKSVPQPPTVDAELPPAGTERLMVLREQADHLGWTVPFAAPYVSGDEVGVLVNAPTAHLVDALRHLLHRKGERRRIRAGYFQYSWTKDYDILALDLAAPASQFAPFSEEALTFVLTIRELQPNPTDSAGDLLRRLCAQESFQVTICTMIPDMGAVANVRLPLDAAARESLRQAVQEATVWNARRHTTEEWVQTEARQILLPTAALSPDRGQVHLSAVIRQAYLRGVLRHGSRAELEAVARGEDLPYPAFMDVTPRVEDIGPTRQALLRKILDLTSSLDQFPPAVENLLRRQREFLEEYRHDTVTAPFLLEDRVVLLVTVAQDELALGVQAACKDTAPRSSRIEFHFRLHDSLTHDYDVVNGEFRLPSTLATEHGQRELWLHFYFCVQPTARSQYRIPIGDSTLLSKLAEQEEITSYFFEPRPLSEPILTLTVPLADAVRTQAREALAAATSFDQEYRHTEEQWQATEAYHILSAGTQRQRERTHLLKAIRSAYRHGILCTGSAAELVELVNRGWPSPLPRFSGDGKVTPVEGLGPKRLAALQTILEQHPNTASLLQASTPPERPAKNG